MNSLVDDQYVLPAKTIKWAGGLYEENSFASMFDPQLSNDDRKSMANYMARTGRYFKDLENIPHSIDELFNRHSEWGNKPLDLATLLITLREVYDWLSINTYTIKQLRDHITSPLLDPTMWDHFTVQLFSHEKQCLLMAKFLDNRTKLATTTELDYDENQGDVFVYRRVHIQMVVEDFDRYCGDKRIEEVSRLISPSALTALCEFCYTMGYSVHPIIKESKRRKLMRIGQNENVISVSWAETPLQHNTFESHN